MQNINQDPLGVPVYLKTEDTKDWPQHKMFYLLSANGLYICRNHEWFQSCAPAKTGPSNLVQQKSFCHTSYPAIPKLLLERAVGFFRRVFQEHHWESALILVWNRQTEEMELVCPEQKNSWESVKYDIPNLPPHMALIGDAHCHCDFSPKPSFTDENDEMKRAGIHIIVGYVDRKKPEFFCAIVVDGERFEADINIMIEGYDNPCSNEDVPKEWLDKVKETQYAYSGDYHHGGGMGGPWTGQNGNEKLSKEDARIMKSIIEDFKKKGKRPEFTELRLALFAGTKEVTHLYCEKKAKKILDQWYDKEEEVKDEQAA